MRPMFGRARLLVLILAVVLAVVVLAALAAFADFERRETLGRAQDRAELVALTLEDHITRTIESASLILRTLGDGITQQPSADPQRLQPLLGQSLLATLPFLRSAAVLDGRGRVLASSIAGEQDTHVDLRKLGPRPADGKDVLLPWLPGRSLADLTPNTPPARAPGVGMLPLVRALRGPGGESLLLVALINPGALANFQQVALSDEGSVALLSSLGGRLIAANDQMPLDPGRQIEDHPVYTQWLPAREIGAYIGPGVQQGTQVVAFRTSRTRPLVVLVEQPEQVALQAWYGQLGWLSLVGLLALGCIASGAAVLLREMNAREQAHSALDLAHEEVARRERELSVLLKSVQELIFRTDVNGVITFVNARWAAFSEEQFDQAMGRHLQDFVAPQDKEQVAALFRLDDRVGVRNAQVCIPGATGGLRHFQVAVVPLHSQGRIVGFAGSAVDVSERVFSDQQLQHQLAFTGLLLEMSPLPVSMFDAQGRYVIVNHVWEEFVGRSRADVIGTQVGHFITPEDAALHAEQDERLLNSGGRLRYEMRVPHRDGSRRDMLITKVLVPSNDGGVAGILCTLLDVSEFRDAERATREARDAAEEASRSKSEFIANISHELRTPLQAILGYSELGLTRGRDTPKLAGMFTDIHNSGQRMLALVNDLLDVSKIESSVGTFDLERCDLRSLVHSVLRELDPLFAKRQLRLSLQLPDEALDAKVDPLRIQQVLRNVLANAIKFSPDAGAIEVCGAVTMERAIEITVADRGPGIPPAELNAIFEAFVQSSKTKDGSGGTGLGLAICRKIVEIHGGHIAAENRSGGGALFRICLPMRVSGDTQVSAAY